MSDRREEIDMELAWLDARDAFVAEKAKRGTEEWDEDAYRAAKAKVSEMRTTWRGIGEYLGLRSPAGAISVTQGDQPEGTVIDAADISGIVVETPQEG